MKAKFILEYDTDNFDEVKEIKAMQNGPNYKSVIWEIEQELRNKLKHEPLSDEVSNALQEVRDSIWRELNADNLTID